MDRELKFILNIWNAPYGELQSEDSLNLRFYRTSYEDEISKKELAVHLASLENWVSFAYDTKRLFHVTALLKDNDQPYADIIFNEGNCIVQYIDDYNRIYMTYTFVGDVKSGYLFLNELQYFVYPKDLQEFAMRRANIEYNQYNFTIDGKLTVTKETRENNRTIYKTVDEAAHPIDVSKNWEPYPNLGEYESIVKMKRWEDGDFLKNPPPVDFMKMISPN